MLDMLSDLKHLQKKKQKRMQKMMGNNPEEDQQKLPSHRGDNRSGIPDIVLPDFGNFLDWKWACR